MNWAVDNYLAGGHTLAMTATAAGNASVLAVDRPSVTPGTEYLAYAYLQPPTLSATAWIELRFYDAVGNQVAAQRSTLAAPGTGMYRQRASMVAPSNAATCSVAAGLDTASAGQVLRLETVVVTAAPKLQAGSILSYGDSSFEQGVGGWTTGSGVATLARTTPWGGAYFEGSYALSITSSTATQSSVRSGRFGGVTAGLNFRAQVIVHIAAGSWSAVGVRIRWYDASNVDLGVSTGVSWAVSGGGWYALNSDAVAPAGATQAAIDLLVTASATSSVLQIDQAVLWQVLPQTEAVAVDEGGYVRLTLRELTVDDEVSVYRVTTDGSRSLVRGSAGLVYRQPITDDLLIIEDHEAPLNTLVRLHDRTERARLSHLHEPHQRLREGHPRGHQRSVAEGPGQPAAEPEGRRADGTGLGSADRPVRAACPRPTHRGRPVGDPRRPGGRPRCLDPHRRGTQSPPAPPQLRQRPAVAGRTRAWASTTCTCPSAGYEGRPHRRARTGAVADVDAAAHRDRHAGHHWRERRGRAGPGRTSSPSSTPAPTCSPCTRRVRTSCSTAERGEALYPVSDRFLPRLAESHQVATRVQLFLTTGQVIDLDHTGRVGAGGPRAGDPPHLLRHRADPALIPRTPTDQLATYGARLRIARGVYYGDGSSELVPLGVFRLDSMSTATSTTVPSPSRAKTSLPSSRTTSSRRPTPPPAPSSAP
jgi:hypothetical protein